MSKEKPFENKVKDWLEEQGIYSAGKPQDKKTVPDIGWFFKVWGGGYQKSGIPDLIICVNGFFISCEVKGDDGRPTSLQKKNTAAINQANGIGVVLYPDGFEQFKEIVKGVMSLSCQTQDINRLKVLNNTKGCQVIQVW